MRGTFSNRPALDPPTLESLRNAMAKLERLPRLPGVIYVREDVWPELEENCLAMMAAVGKPGSARGVLEELFPSLLGFPGCSIRIELRKVLPKPWITDIELERLETLLRPTERS